MTFVGHRTLSERRTQKLKINDETHRKSLIHSRGTAVHGTTSVKQRDGGKHYRVTKSKVSILTLRSI